MFACNGTSSAAIAPTQTMFGGDRPVELRVPIDYDHEVATPLVLVLHGHGATGAVQLAYSRLGNLPFDQGVFVIAPDGLVNAEGNGYWRIDHGACKLEPNGPDDVAYLIALVDEVSSVYNIDPQRVFVFGHSNGGFMAYQLACDHADRFAAIISLAGSTSIDPGECNPSEPVSVLQIHGDADDTVPYAGGDEIIGIPCEHPSAQEMVSVWASYNQCTGPTTAADREFDLVTPFDGPDTHVLEASGCPDTIATELWTIEGGSHVPSFGNGIEEALWNFFEAHPKPAM